MICRVIADEEHNARPVESLPNAFGGRAQFRIEQACCILYEFGDILRREENFVAFPARIVFEPE